MSQPTTLSMLAQTPYANALGTTYNITGNAVKASNYLNSTFCGNQTVNISTTNLVGNVIIEATLLSEPSTNTTVPSDWFTVHKIIANHWAPVNTPENIASNTNTAINVPGNFVWMRARVENFNFGIINWIKLSY